MCQYKYTQHSCGHIIPKLEENYDASCKLCVPVLVALKYYHDQPTHECLENARQQPPLRIPKPCRPVGPHIMGDAEKITNILAQDQARFERIMDEVGVNSAERSFIAQLALRHDQTSKRIIKMPLLPVSQRKIDFVRELEMWQQRQYQPPNITYNSVSWGCGGTGPGVQGHCLVGWTGLGILMYRHGIWNVNPPHPSHAWSPLPARYLYIDYGKAPVLQLPADWQNEVTRTLIDIPMYECLYTVLHGRPSGPMIQNDQGYLVPALGASGPGIPAVPQFPPPQPQLPIPTGQLRPTQTFVSTARPRQGPGHRYSATWNSPGLFNQAAGPSKPNEYQKQRTHKEGYSQRKTKAGPGQSVDRAKINTKIKQLPQQRVSRSGTPATTASAQVSQPVYSTHQTPGSKITRPATSTGNLAQLDEPAVGLGIIDESSPAAPVEDTVGNAEGRSSRIYYITIYLANDSQTLFFTNLPAIALHNPTKHMPTKQEPRHLNLKARNLSDPSPPARTPTSNSHPQQTIFPSTCPQTCSLAPVNPQHGLQHHHIPPSPLTLSSRSSRYLASLTH